MHGLVVFTSVPIIGSDENALDSKTASTKNKTVRALDVLQPFCGSALNDSPHPDAPETGRDKNCGVAPIRLHLIVAENILVTDSRARTVKIRKLTGRKLLRCNHMLSNPLATT
jgi:hypothetical protein